ncbi:tripartite tricarboxylate transporter substrate binding protein [Thalassorhabdomicrobium marinisediminis]|uniref:Tripartite tricarboxylate transporter substrate-binding protein n=1 Tax=Thalassorhabdomicrobium marinisediminis TaxID=2170577 RepID=A0A2T7FZC8_9RHOB|nr:tripartite tricarboxylate transporter substrate binding protein [Thalassorhabdomicrobium marinisediminis]PVA07520.1 tripartite tricarboxylate transporter substrate-binding protein [Thalassorhabdomicrobium marinisediminis]
MNIFRTAMFASAAALVASAALAEYPERDIELLVGFSAGGGTDVMARTLEPFLEKYIGDGANVVIKNIPGASGQIAVTQVAEAEPDGYTIGTYNLPGVMARTLDREADYTADSFTYLANVVNDPNVIVTPQSSSITSMAQLIEEAEADPGAITMGISGLGGDDHFMFIALEDATATDFTLVPFGSSAPTRTAIMGGHVAAGILNVSEIAGFEESIRVLAIASEESSEYAPDVPTLKSEGIDVVNGSLRGFVAPEGLSEEVEQKLMDAFRQTFDDPEFQQAMRDTSNPTRLSLGEDFRMLNNAQLEFAKRVWETSPWK